MKLRLLTKACWHVQSVGRAFFPRAVTEQPGISRVDTDKLFGHGTTHYTSIHIAITAAAANFCFTGVTAYKLKAINS